MPRRYRSCREGDAERVERGLLTRCREGCEAPHGREGRTEGRGRERHHQAREEVREGCEAARAREGHAKGRVGERSDNAGREERVPCARRGRSAEQGRSVDIGDMALAWMKTGVKMGEWSMFLVLDSF